jgi:deoxyribonuclease IV
LAKSIDWLIYALSMADRLGVRGVIIHTGSHKGRGFDSILPQVVSSIKNILARTSGSLLILETSAGGGGSIGRDFRELGLIIKAVNDPRLKICIDTQHVFAGGYDLKTKIGLNDALVELEEEVGLSNLECFHANDSKVEYRSGRDRHENIGEGFIGAEGFENLVNHPKLKDIPFILEVPGFSGNGPDTENIQKLKSLIKEKRM